MGRFKERGAEGIRELQENSRETTDLGSEMQEDAQEIRQLLDSISLQDDEDITAVSDTKSSYQGSFDTAFSDRVETAGQKIESQSEQILSEINVERDNVRDGIQSMERAGGVSEIGRDVADAGGRKLEQSDSEYEGIQNDAERVADDTAQKIAELKSNVNRVFG